MRDQEVSHQKVRLSRTGDANDGDGTDGPLAVAWISVSCQPGELLLLLFSNQNMLFLSLCGKGCSAGRGERAYLRDHSQIWPDIQGFCSRNLGSHPARNRTVKAPEEKEVPASHLDSDLVPLKFSAIGSGTP